MKTKKQMLEAKLSTLLKYGQITLRGMKAYRQFEAYAYDNGYEIKQGGLMDGISITAFLVVHE